MNHKEKIPIAVTYPGPQRHSKIFKDEFVRLFPQSIIETLEKANKIAEEKENKESILFTPHPIDYSDPVNFE